MVILQIFFRLIVEMYKWLCEQHGNVILSIVNLIIPGGDANGYLNDVFPF